MDKVRTWRTALRDAANLSGWTFLDGHEANFINKIVEEISAQVSKRSYLNVARRSRLWFHEDVYRVLTENTGSNKVKGIRVELLREDEICLSAKCFKKMKNLQLFININARFSGEVDYLPNQLRFLDWPGFPLQSFPSDFNPQKLVELNIPYSRIKRLGQGFKNLQNLKSLSFGSCPKLVPFSNKVEYTEVPTPTSNSKISRYGKAISSERESDDEHRQGNLAFPRLGGLDVRGCNIWDCGFLMTLGCASTLRVMDLSANNFVTLPACISKFINLEELKLIDCKRLQQVPKLPPNMKKLHVSGCVSLERISKLSNILNRQESQMLEWMDLTNCWRLCDNLVHEAEKKGLLVNDHHLFSLFLSSQKSAFEVVFPGSHEIPKWFSSQMDFKGNGLFEFYIDVLPNFKWENTGLALCVAAEENVPWEFQIWINEEQVKSNVDRIGHNYKYHRYREPDSAWVWLFYIPFNLIDLRPFGYKRPLPPFQCRVIIYQWVYSGVVPFKGCGVHLVMPPNEGLCMKLSHAQNLTDYFLIPTNDSKLQKF
ncbi:hypothetical protein M0R45_027755 [Rubus argutus]|uniref:Disease resistance protein RPS4B/Roq1-like leucine-rich repeats domain-containing protein n=1 Tax=Rubus argutus TaxID=59490 RepID=A0AAW1X193_RUBAR